MLLIAGAFAIVLLVAYRRTFSVPFVFDDTPSITNNPSIRQLGTAWWAPKDITTTSRPVVNLSLALNYALHGFAVRGYHVVNLAIHFCATLALFGVVRRTLRSACIAPALARDATLVATGVALLWAVHPLQTESVTYVIQRAESLMGLFYLLTLYCFIRGIDRHPVDDNRSVRHDYGWPMLSFVACLLGMATKEVMVSAPVIVLLYDRTFVAGTFREALRRRRGYYAALAATWLVLAVLVLMSEGRGGTAGLGTKISSWAYALTQCHAIVHYLRLAFWPAPLVFDYGTDTLTTFTAALAPAAVLILLAGGTLFSLRARPSDAARFDAAQRWPGLAALGFLGAWFFAILAPTSSVMPIATQTIAEHRMYLPLAAVATLVVLALHRLLGRRGAVAVFAAAVALIMITTQRNETYATELTLWSDTAAKMPRSSRAHYNLGWVLLQSNRGAEALPHFEEALRLKPDYVEALVNDGIALRSVGRLEAAIAPLEAALRLNPDYFEAHLNLGISLTQIDRTADALAHLDRALQLNPSSAAAHGHFGYALMKSGHTDEGIAQFAEAAGLKPNDFATLERFGFALLNARRPREAITQLEAALRLDPLSATAQNHLGLALAQSGRAPDALAHLEQAARLQPDDAGMHNDLGTALAMAGRLPEALQHFEEAARLKPNFAEAARNRDRARAQLSGR